MNMNVFMQARREVKKKLAAKDQYCFCQGEGTAEMWKCEGGGNWCPFRAFIHVDCAANRGEEVEDDDELYYCFFCKEWGEKLRALQPKKKKKQQDQSGA